MEHVGDASVRSDMGYVSTVSRYRAQDCTGCSLRGMCYKEARDQRVIEVNHQGNAYRAEAKALLSERSERSPFRGNHMPLKNSAHKKTKEADTFGRPLCADVGVLSSVITDFGLFVVDEGMFWSDYISRSVDDGREMQRARQQAGRQGASRRWKQKEAEAPDEAADSEPDECHGSTPPTAEECQNDGKPMANQWQTNGKTIAMLWQTNGKTIAKLWQTNGKAIASR